METISLSLQNVRSIAALFLFLSFTVFITACDPEQDRDIVVSGDLLSSNSTLEGKMIYLGNSSSREFMDSVIVKNGKFQFRIKPGEDFVPVKCSILFATGNPSWPYQPVGYKNPYFAKTQESIIYADRGEMQLRRDTTLKVSGRDQVSFIIANPNKQTQAAFRHLAFKPNPGASAEISKFNVALVKQYPYSIDLLNQLEWSKKDIGEEELRVLISSFEPALQKSRYFRKINNYLKVDNTTGGTFPSDLSLKMPDNKATSHILDENAKYNLVVFWASWCGPCRQEIPQLKKLYAKHKKRVSITSISTDTNASAWKNALKQEQMPWKQFIVDEESMARLDRKYNLQSIPVTLLFDENNNLIERKIGYGADEERVEATVELHLLDN